MKKGIILVLTVLLMITVGLSIYSIYNVFYFNYNVALNFGSHWFPAWLLIAIALYFIAISILIAISLGKVIKDKEPFVLIIVTCGVVILVPVMLILLSLIPNSINWLSFLNKIMK